MSATSGPTTDQALLFAACFKRGHIGPSGCLRVGPRQGAMVGPNGAVVAIRKDLPPLVPPSHGRGYGPGGGVKIAWVPTRRQMTWAWPGMRSSP